jgi:hypothetical protein
LPNIQEVVHQPPNFQYPQQPYNMPPNYGRPAPKGMSAGKVVAIVFGVIATLLFGTCAVCTMVIGVGANAVEKKKAEEKIQVEKQLAECAQIEAVHWSVMAGMLKDNEAAVAAAWKGSCAKISGTVKSINSGIGDKTTVIIDSGERLSFDSLHCEPKNPQNAMYLSKGQTITVWGIGGNEVLGSLMLEHCDW